MWIGVQNLKVKESVSTLSLTDRGEYESVNKRIDDVSVRALIVIL